MGRILIAGGAGFIGCHLTQTLLDAGEQVVCIDNLSSGRRENITGFLENRDYEFKELDITEEFMLNDIKQIYNLASLASPIFYQKKPVQTLMSSGNGVINLLSIAMKNDARMLQASTSEVYGDPLQHPQSESYWGNVNPVGMRSCYNEAKRYAEAMMTAYAREHETQVRIARIFNTYGPMMRKDDGRVIPGFIEQALSRNPITVYGDGTQTRSFCYVKDTVDGLMRLMASDYKKPVNIGNPVEKTILELAEKIIMLCESGSKIIFKKLPSDDPLRRKPDISLARLILDWNPTTTLDAGLEETVKWHKNSG